MYYETFISVDLVGTDTVSSHIWHDGKHYVPLKDVSILKLDRDGIMASLALSIFTDRRQPFTGNRPSTPDDRRGWWGDKTLEPGDKIGSRLWQLARRSMQGTKIINEAETMLKESVAWMIEDAVAEFIAVKAARVDNVTLGFSISLRQPNDAKTTRYDFLWRQMSGNSEN